MAVARRTAPDAPTLTLRELNRARLARQMLLGRERVAVVTAVASQAVLEMTPFVRIGGADRRGLLEEGERLARFLTPEARSHGARV